MYKCVNKKAKGFGDTVEILENHFESRSSVSDGKNRIESILKKETKRQRAANATNGLKWNINTTEKCRTSDNQILNKLTSRNRNMGLVENKDDVFTHVDIRQPIVQRKIIKTEWAVTRIFTFNDNSQTYEVMKKDKVLQTNGSIDKIFAIAPNLTTIAYDPLKQ